MSDGAQRPAVRQSGRSGGARLFIALLAVGCLALALAGCGFRLRGSLGGLEALPPLHLRGADPVVMELDRVLRGGGARLVDDIAQARLIVTVLDARRDRRVLSVGTTGRVREYELHYALRFRVDDAGGRPVLDTQTVPVVRDFSFDETDVVAKSNEEEQLFRDMQRDAARQVARRLQALGSLP